MNISQTNALLLEFSCPVCFEFMDSTKGRSPKSLHCSHTVCDECVKALLKNNDHECTCPICRKITPSDSSVIATNFTMVRMMEMLNINFDAVAKNITCGNCDQAHAVVHCFDCCVYYCVDCNAAHGKMKGNKGHKSQTVETLKDKVVANKPTDVCKTHKDQQIKLYCETCKVFICGDCTYIDHPSATHTLLFIHDALEKYTSEIRTELTRAKEAITQSNQAFIDAANLKETRSQEKKKIIQRVKTELDEVAFTVETALKVRTAFVVNSVGDILDLAANNQALDNDMNRVAPFVQSMQQAVDATESALREKSAVEIINSRTELIAQTSQLGQYYCAYADRKSLPQLVDLQYNLPLLLGVVQSVGIVENEVYTQNGSPPPAKPLERRNVPPGLQFIGTVILFNFKNNPNDSNCSTNPWGITQVSIPHVATVANCDDILTQYLSTTMKKTPFHGDPRKPYIIPNHNVYGYNNNHSTTTAQAMIEFVMDLCNHFVLKKYTYNRDTQTRSYDGSLFGIGESQKHISMRPEMNGLSIETIHYFDVYVGSSGGNITLP